MRRPTFRPPPVAAPPTSAPWWRGLPVARLAVLLGAAAGAFFLSAVLGADPATAGDRTGATPNTIRTPAGVALLGRVLDAVDPPGPAPRGTGGPPVEVGEGDRGPVPTSTGRRGRSPERAGVSGADHVTAADDLLAARAARAARVTRGVAPERDDPRAQRRGDERKRDRSRGGVLPVDASAVVRPVTTGARAVLKPAVTGGTAVVGPVVRTARSTTTGVLTRVTGLVGVAVPVPSTTPGHAGEPSSPRVTEPDAPPPAAAWPSAIRGQVRPARGTTGAEGAAPPPGPAAEPPLAPAPASGGATWCPEPSGATSAGTVPLPADPPPGPLTSPDDDCATTTDGGGGPASPPAVDADKPTSAGRVPVRPSVAPGERLSGTDARPG